MTTKPTPQPLNINNAPWLNEPATQHVFAALNQNGHIARAVGGCVRNSLLASHAHEPAETPAATTDIDIATTAHPEQNLALAAAAGLKTVPTGLQHGTITIIADGRPFEVTTLRRDVTTDGRRAEVAFTDDWAMDAARRDFTMNALYADAAGTVFDPLGGYSDLRAGIVRFVGDPATRICEDYLRILRFFRFFAEYGRGDLDTAGLAACVKNRHGLTRLSPERLRQELIKLVAAKGAERTMTTMAHYGILSEILPVAPNISRLATLIRHDTPPDAILRIATLTVHVDENVETISRRLRLSNNETTALATIATAIGALSQNNEPKIDAVAARKILYRHGQTAYQRIIKFRWTLSGAGSSDPTWRTLLDLPKSWQPPSLPITGRDLIALGAIASPKLGDILSTLETQWIDSDFTADRPTLIARARQLIEKTRTA